MSHPYLAAAADYRSALVRDLRQLVECESPSDVPFCVEQANDLLVETTRDLAKPRLFKAPGYARHLLLSFVPSLRRQRSPKRGRILGLGHMDTVWPLRTITAMPWREANGRLWGPGILDMKAGLLFFVYAVRILRDLDVPVNREVALLVVSDEEVGSPTSRVITETEAKRSGHVLVLEPGTGLTGKLKTARKSVARYRVSVTGRAAHAGVDFEQGASAILEAAQVVQRCAAFTDTGRGCTVNPGVVRGGTRSNVVADHAEIEIDVRAVRMADALRIDKMIRSLRPVDRRCQLQVEGGVNRPPMERTRNMASLFRRAAEIASELGIALEESATGGGSDGNFTAALGIPTLDGLGAVGEGAHAAHESILIDEMNERVALLASLIAGL